MSTMKTLETKLTERERYVIWVHLEKNVMAQSGREQDQIDDVRSSLSLDEIQARVDEREEAGGAALMPRDFSDVETIDVTVTKEELGFLLALLVRPMPAALSRFTLPIKRRLEAERDKKGLRAVEAG